MASTEEGDATRKRMDDQLEGVAALEKEGWEGWCFPASSDPIDGAAGRGRMEGGERKKKWESGDAQSDLRQDCRGGIKQKKSLAKRHRQERCGSISPILPLCLLPFPRNRRRSDQISDASDETCVLTPIFQASLESWKTRSMMQGMQRGVRGIGRRRRKRRRRREGERKFKRERERERGLFVELARPNEWSWVRCVGLGSDAGRQAHAHAHAFASSMLPLASPLQ